MRATGLRSVDWTFWRSAAQAPGAAQVHDLPSEKSAPTWQAIGFALLLVGAAFTLTLFLQSVGEGRPTLFFFFAAIVFAAWLGGAPSALVAVAASIPAGYYFYGKADHPHVLLLNVSLFSLFVLFCAGVGTYLNRRQQSVEAALRKANRDIAAKARALEAANEDLTLQMQQRREAERALQESQAQVMRMSRLTAMGHVAASIAHEVNQPLVGVLTNAGSALRWLSATPPDLGEVRGAMERVVRDGARASDVVNHIRDMVRRGLPQPEALDLNVALRGVVDLLRRDLDEQRIDIVWALSQEPPHTLGDKVQLQQLFLNLILNALHALSAAEPRRIRLGTRCAGDMAIVEVEDTGPGIAPERLANLFDAFKSTKPNGMGLGLPICRTIAESHGGGIAARNGDNGGAVFCVTLPLLENGS